MSKPSVCAVCLVNGRPEMVKRAIRSFEAQTYENKRLVIYDSGELIFDGCERGCGHLHVGGAHQNRSVGALRNAANDYVKPLHRDVIVHWDSDDYSHPSRIAEQVALLESSGKEVVGYRDMLFWDETPGQFCGAWMYENRNPKFLLGTSLCYWRSVWERKPFPDLPIPGKPQSAGEDTTWLSGLNRLGKSSVTPNGKSFGAYTIGLDRIEREADNLIDGLPRMIASIHGGNTTGFWLQHRDKEPMFRRAPEWDEYCRERMQL